MSRVLVVDDAASNRLVLTALLKRAGHEVATAVGVEDAEQRMSVFLPDAIITDLRMPGEGDGVRLARIVRQRWADRPVRLALMTGDAGTFDNAEGLFDAVLEKPVPLAMLQGFLEGAGQ